MILCGIVAEYNPFHLGHAHHIAQTRAALGAESGIVCAMSGNFVQRGEAAIFSKFARAEAAVCAGADLVLELPLPWALSSAEGFARGAVSLLAATGAVTHLSFGSECGAAAQIEHAAETLLHPALDAALRTELAVGDSYAAARQRAAERIAGRALPVLSAPNDLLAVEYCKAIRRYDLPLTPIAIARVGAGHDSAEACEFPSAALLRSCIAAGESAAAHIPAAAQAVYARECAQGRGPVLPAALETAILSRLRMLPPEAYAALPDASEGLGERLCRAAMTEPTLDAVLAAAKTKRYAFSRLRRMVLCAALGLRAGDADGTPPYLRVLAANCRGTEILREMQRSARVPILTKPAAVRELSTQAQRIFRLEAAAGDLYALGFPAQSECAGGRDWRSSPAILRD